MTPRVQAVGTALDEGFQADVLRAHLGGAQPGYRGQPSIHESGRCSLLPTWRRLLFLSHVPS